MSGFGSGVFGSGVFEDLLMATTVSLSDGTTTIDLNAATSTTIGTEWIRLPRLNRRYARVGAFPFTDGQRTAAHGLDDTEIEIACHIRGTSADNVEAQYIALVRLLEAALRWETSRIGAPVRLSWKRNTVTNYAYWNVRYGSVELSRDPEWLSAETANNILHLLVRLVVEPAAHAGALTTLRSAIPLLNAPLANYDGTTATQGDIGYCPSIEITRTAAGTAWTQAYLAQVFGQSDLNDRTGTVDAAAYGGEAQQIVNPGALTIATYSSFITTDTKHQYPLRFMARVKVVSGTVSKIQLRSRFAFGVNGPSQVGAWVTFPGTATGSYMMMDLGPVSLTAGLQRQATSTLQYAFTCDVRTSDGSSATVNIDFIEAVPYLGFVKLTGLTLIQDRKLIYEDVQLVGSFVLPRPQPLAYLLATTGELFADVSRFGRLVRPPINSSVATWFYGQTDTTHTFSDGFAVTTKALPLYSMGLRGAA
jgi:hypothetical protein